MRRTRGTRAGIRRVVPLLAGCMLLAACGGSASPAATGSASSGSGAAASSSAGSAQQTLVQTLISTGTNKVPAFTTTGEDTAVINLIYGSLLAVDPQTLKIGPSLATSYTVSPDGKTWTFQLRHGVQWEYGYGEFTCADVQFTWNFNKDPANHSFYEKNAEIVSSVDCPDPYTAVFHLATPYQGFIWDVVNMEPSTGWIMSKAAWAKLGKDGYNKTPVGTGPYELQSLTPNQDIILVANPNYWGPKVGVDRIDYKVITDAQTAALAVKSGSVDIAGVDPVTAQQYANTPGVTVYTRHAFEVDWLALNESTKPFNDLRVRQAARYAIDYPDLVKTVLRGYGTPGYQGMVLPGQTGYDATNDPQNVYDPAKAKQLLQEAGISPSTQYFFTTYNDTSDVNAAQFITANFQAVGLNLQGRPLERGTLVQVRIQPTTPASIIGDALSPDPDSQFSGFISATNPPAGLNISRSNDIDQLYQQDEAAPNPAARAQILSQIQATFTKDVPDILLYAKDDIWLLNDRVHNFVGSILFNSDPLNQVTLSQ
jgi:peptide/nickel transport system substrate-binding protein